jgi:signal transduction histidine kinase
LLNLVNDILDLSAIESAKTQLAPETFSAQDTVNDLIKLSQPLAQKHQVTLINQIDDANSLLLYADETRFKQALLNLISNAIKYNILGGTVRLEMQALSDNQVRISVIDTGPGIENHKLESIFEAFHREKLKDASIEGAGIGLTITRKIVESMNGKISVESIPGKGSCFSIDLPNGKKQDISSPKPEENLLQSLDHK